MKEFQKKGKACAKALGWMKAMVRPGAKRRPVWLEHRKGGGMEIHNDSGRELRVDQKEP